MGVRVEAEEEARRLAPGGPRLVQRVEHRHRREAIGVPVEGRLRKRGGAPRNPAPRNHFLGWIVKA